MPGPSVLQVQYFRRSPVPNGLEERSVFVMPWPRRCPCQACDPVPDGGRWALRISSTLAWMVAPGDDFSFNACPHARSCPIQPLWVISRARVGARCGLAAG